MLCAVQPHHVPATQRRVTSRRVHRGRSLPTIASCIRPTPLHDTHDTHGIRGTHEDRIVTSPTHKTQSVQYTGPTVSQQHYQTHIPHLSRDLTLASCQVEPPPAFLLQTPQSILTRIRASQTTQGSHSISQHVMSCQRIHGPYIQRCWYFLPRHHRDSTHTTYLSSPTANSFSPQTRANLGNLSESAHTFKTWEYINTSILIII